MLTRPDVPRRMGGRRGVPAPAQERRRCAAGRRDVSAQGRGRGPGSALSRVPGPPGAWCSRPPRPPPGRGRRSTVLPDCARGRARWPPSLRGQAWRAGDGHAPAARQRPGRVGEASWRLSDATGSPRGAEVQGRPRPRALQERPGRASSDATPAPPGGAGGRGDVAGGWTHPGGPRAEHPVSAVSPPGPPQSGPVARPLTPRRRALAVSASILLFSLPAERRSEHWSLSSATLVLWCFLSLQRCPQASLAIV